MLLQDVSSFKIIDKCFHSIKHVSPQKSDLCKPFVSVFSWNQADKQRFSSNMSNNSPVHLLSANTGSVGRDVGDVGRGGRGGRGGREGREGRGGRGGHGGREGREGRGVGT